MNLYNTVSKILGREVSEEEAKSFAVGQFGALSAYLKEEAKKEITIESSKQFLKDNGYFVDNLWQVADVKGKYKCTDEQAQDILNSALTKEATMEQIQFSIREFSEIENFPEYSDCIFSINGFFKDTKEKFSNHLICSYDCLPDDETVNEEDIFFFGLTENDIIEAISLKWNTAHDFVITSYEPTTLN